MLLSYIVVPKFPPIVWALILGSTGVFFAFFMCFPFFAIYFAEHAKMTPFEIGLVIALGPLAQTFGGFYFGNLADRIGRTRIMVVSMLVFGLTFIGFAAVGMLGYTPYTKYLFALLNTLSGLAGAAFFPASQAVIADSLATETRHLAFRFRYCAINVGTAIGPIVGASLGVLSSHSAFIFTGVIAMIYAVVLWKMSLTARSVEAVKIREKNSKYRNVSLTEAFQIVRQDRMMRAVVFSAILLQVAYVQIDVTLSMHMKMTFEEGIRYFSYLISTNGLCVVFVQLLFMPAISKMKVMNSIVIGCVLISVGYLGFASAQDILHLYIFSMIVLTVGEILYMPTNNILVDEIAPEHLRATYYGASGFRNLGSSIGPIVGGMIFQFAGGKVVFVTMAFVALAAAWVCQAASPDTKLLTASVQCLLQQSRRLRERVSHAMGLLG